jgi:hypothetical protein
MESNMKRVFVLALAVLLSTLTLSAQNANVKYSGDAQSGEKVYSCAYDGFVNMRQAPSFKAAKIGKFKNGPTGATLIRNLGEWMEINYNGVRGYVPSRFVQDEPTVAYTGTATVKNITGIWYNFFFGPLYIYENGYWSAFGNYYFSAYGYYILENNQIKLIAIREIDFDDMSSGLPGYAKVRKEYGIINISDLTNDRRGTFLTGYESEEEVELLEGEGVPHYTAAEFKNAGKHVKEYLEKDILDLEERKVPISKEE